MGLLALLGLRRAAKTARRGGDEAADAAKASDEAAEASGRSTLGAPPRSASDSKLVGIGKYAAGGYVAKEGISQGGQYLQAREDAQKAQAETEKYDQFLAEREEIMNTEMPPDVKAERLKLLRETYKQSTGDESGGGIMDKLFGGVGKLEMVSIIITLIIIYTVVSRAGGP